VSFERVRDWKALECQRHICEIQGAVGAIAHPLCSLVIGRERHICEIQGEPCPLESQAAWTQEGLDSLFALAQGGHT